VRETSLPSGTAEVAVERGSAGNAIDGTTEGTEVGKADGTAEANDARMFGSKVLLSMVVVLISVGWVDAKAAAVAVEGAIGSVGSEVSSSGIAVGGVGVNAVAVVAVGCRPMRSASLVKMSLLVLLIGSLLMLAETDDEDDVVLVVPVCSAAATAASAVIPVALFMVLIILSSLVLVF
jgi:hypothetical protein